MAGRRAIDLEGSRAEALWREERRRSDLALGDARRTLSSPRHVRRGIGAGMAVLLALLALSVVLLLASLFRSAGSWFAGTIMPHFLRHEAAPTAAAETVRAVAGALGWLFGFR